MDRKARLVTQAAFIVAITTFIPYELLAFSHSQVIESKTIAQKIADNHRLIESMHIRVKCSEEYLVDKTVVFRWLNKVPLHNGSEEFAFKDNKRFLSLIHEGNVQSLKELPRPEVDLSASPDARKQQAANRKYYDDSVAAAQKKRDSSKPVGFGAPNANKPLYSMRSFNGKTLKLLTSKSQGEVFSGRSMPSHQFTFVYFLLAGMNVEDPTDSDQMKSEMKASSISYVIDKYNYDAVDDTIGGVPCLRMEGIVANAGMKDRIWLDPERGFSILKRELIDNKTGRINSRILNSNLKEVGEGAWLPMSCILEEYAPPHSPTELSAGPLSRIRLDVLLCDINDVSDDVFDMKFDEGVLVADYSANSDKHVGPVSPVVYTSGSGDDLDKSINQVRQRRFLILVMANVGGIFAVLIAFLVRRRRAGVKPT